MHNPIIQAMSRRQNNNVIDIFNTIKSGNPEALFNQLKQTNPQFRKFLEDNKGKSIEQIAQENGIDINSLNQLF